MKPRMSQRIQFSLAYLLVAIIVLSLLQSWLLSPRTIEIPMSKFLELLKADQIEKVAVTEREIRGIAKPGALPTPPSAAGDRLRKMLGSEEEPRVFVTTRIPLVDDQQLVQELRAHHVEFAGRLPKGVLLVGPPGTGKTLLARAVAGEADVPFFTLSGSEFVEMFVGVGAARVRDLFEQAKDKAPCIIFLAEMDGFDSSKGVIIMAATNRPEVLDQALLRPGRFDRQVVVDKPDVRGREAILRLHARAVVLAPGVDLGVIAARTPGFAGADLANIVNEAALLAARKEKNAVEMADLEEAIDRVVAGLEKKSRVLSEKERDIVAHHEMGHALVASSVTHADPVHKVTIIPRGVAALGMTYQLPTEDRFLLTRSELEDRIAVLLGGRVAEELVYGEVSTGAHNDLERATELARLMVTKYGMSERVGLATYGERTPLFLKASGFGGERDFSEATARTIDEEVRAILDRTHDRVRGLLTTKKSALVAAAGELKRVETLEGEPLRRLLNGEAAATKA